MRCPGLDEWTLDEGHPDGMVYVIPRGPDVICGGTADEGAQDLTPDPAHRRRDPGPLPAVVPELAAAEVLGHAVGLRPVRDRGPAGTGGRRRALLRARRLRGDRVLGLRGRRGPAGRRMTDLRPRVDHVNGNDGGNTAVGSGEGRPHGHR